VTKWPIRIINITPQKPRVPTAYPKRRNKMAPSIVAIAVKNTGAVPNPFLCSVIYMLVSKKLPEVF